MKILIAVPCMDMVSAHFAQCLTTLKKVGECTVSFLIGSLIYDARNKLVEQALQLEADYIMWFDSDMVFSADTLQRMMETLDKHPEIDILSGLYFRRGKPYTPVLFDQLDYDAEKLTCDFKDTLTYPDELFEVAGCGFGCVLMRTDCLIDLGGKYGGTWFSPLGNVGEDCAFCIRARAEGYKIYCNPSIKLGHMSYSPITEGVYKQLMKSMEKLP